MEKNMENDMKTGLYGGYTRKSGDFSYPNPYTKDHITII